MGSIYREDGLRDIQTDRQTERMKGRQTCGEIMREKIYGEGQL